jgi:hypothetical protein
MMALLQGRFGSRGNVEDNATAASAYAPPVSVEGRYVLATTAVGSETPIDSVAKQNELERSRMLGEEDDEEWDSEEEWEEEEGYEQWLRRVTSQLGATDSRPQQQQTSSQAGSGDGAEDLVIPSTEIDLQLGALTLNRRRLQPLPFHLSRHPHFASLFSPSYSCVRGEGNSNHTGVNVGNFQVVEVDLRENYHWLRLVGRRHDLHYWY